MYAWGWWMAKQRKEKKRMKWEVKLEMSWGPVTAEYTVHMLFIWSFYKSGDFLKIIIIKGEILQ